MPNTEEPGWREPPRPTVDKVLRILLDRSGFDHWWGSIDPEYRSEIRDELAALLEDE